MTTFWGRVAYSVNRVFVLCPVVILVISHFGFEGETLILIALVPGHNVPFTLMYTEGL